MSLKLFGRSIFIYSLGNVCLRATPFLLIPVFTHTLSTFDYGVLSTLQYAVQIYLVLMGVGMSECIIRFARDAEAEHRIPVLIGSCVAIMAAATLLCTGVTLGLLQEAYRKMLHVDAVGLLLALVCAAAAAQAISNYFLAYLRALNKAGAFVASNLSISLALFVVSVLFLLVWDLGIPGVLGAQVISYGVAGLVLLALTARAGLPRITRAELKRALRFGGPVLISAGAWIIIGGSVLFYLNWLEGPESVAVFALGSKLSSVMYTVIVIPFQLAFEPYVFANLESPELPARIGRLLTYFLVGFCLLAFGIVVFARIGIGIVAPPEYAESLGMLLLLLPLSLWLGVFTVGRALLHIESRTGITAVIVTVSAALCLVANYFAILWYGILGAALLANVLYPLTGGLTLYYGLKTFPARVEWLRVLTVLGSFGVMIAVFYLLRDAEPRVYYGSAAIASVAALALLWLGRFFTSEELAFLREIRQRMARR